MAGTATTRRSPARNTPAKKASARSVAQREATSGTEPIAVDVRGTVWKLPAELPASIVDPIIDGDLDDVIAVLAEAYGDNTDYDEDESGEDEASDKEFGDKVVAMLRSNPALLSTALRAIKTTFEKLLGKEQWTRWLEADPSFQDYFRLTRGAFAGYGVSLGEALGSFVSFTNDGTTSKQT